MTKNKPSYLPGMLPNKRDKAPKTVPGIDAFYRALDNPEFEQKRETSRASGKITYDCRKCRLSPDEDDMQERRVVCSAGHKLTKASDGSARAIQVVRGVRFGICQACTDYDDER